MATPKGTRSQRFLLKSGDAVHVFSNSQGITLQLRHEVPSEVDVAATSFKAAVVLSLGDALAIAGELLTVAGTQLKAKGPLEKGGRTNGAGPRDKSVERLRLRRS